MVGGPRGPQQPIPLVKTHHFQQQDLPQSSSMQTTPDIAPKNIKEILTYLKAEIDIRTPLTILYRISKQKINKKLI